MSSNLSLLTGAAACCLALAVGALGQTPPWIPEGTALVEAQVTQTQPVDAETLRSTLTISHVYHAGSVEGLAAGATFTTLTQTDTLRTMAITPLLTTGDAALLLLARMEGELIPQRQLWAGAPWPVLDRDKNLFAEAKALAQAVETMARCPAEKAPGQLRELVASNHGRVGAWAVGALAAMPAADLADWLHKARARDLPLRTLLAIDLALVRVQGVPWRDGTDRLTFLQSLCRRELNDDASQLAGDHLSHTFQSGQMSPEALAKLCLALVANPKAADSGRLSAVYAMQIRREHFKELDPVAAIALAALSGNAGTDVKRAAVFQLLDRDLPAPLRQAMAEARKTQADELVIQAIDQVLHPAPPSTPK